MATNLDLEEQEQIDQLKAFWARYGNLITLLLVLAVGAFAAWTGWNWYQREQGIKASALYEELDRAAQAGDMDKTGRVFADLKAKFPSTALAQQGGLLAAEAQFNGGKTDAAQESLTWVGENAIEAEYQTLARLRLAGLLIDQKKYEEALRQLAGATAQMFAALVADRRGDALLALGKTDEARTAYEQAWKAMDAEVSYRTVIDAKLAALGVTPEADQAVAKEAAR
jgi:predicted negative regulator of RcsB-dependent stress response